MITQNSTAPTSQYLSGPIVEGGQADLWETPVSATADIQNTGTVNGSEVAQLYLEMPATDRLRVLRGFDKPFLSAAQTVAVTFDLTRRHLNVCDTTVQRWALPSGTYTVFVGASSRDLRLNGTFNISLMVVV